jgi:hypothetical protein
LVALENNSFWDFRKSLTDGTNSAMIINSLAQYFFRVEDKEPQPYVLLKEKIISDYVGVLMQTNHFLFDAYNENIVRMTESGIMQKITEEQLPKPPEDDQPTVLSLEHLLIWFKVWIGLLLITSAVFIIEFVNAKIQKRQWLSSKTAEKYETKQKRRKHSYI